MSLFGGDLYLDANLGLGDLVIMNGLIRELALHNAEVHVPCWHRNRASADQMFSDVSNVFMCNIDRGMTPTSRLMEAEIVRTHCGVMSVGNLNPHWGEVTSRMPWDQAFYHLAGVPFGKRWDSFRIPLSTSALLIPGNGYAVYHEDVPRGYRIDPSRVSTQGMPKFYVTPSANRPARVIADWVPLLSGATEVHCIDSCIMHLAESIPTKGKLFYHRYAREAGPESAAVCTRRKEWEVLA